MPVCILGCLGETKSKREGEASTVKQAAVALFVGNACSSLAYVKQTVAGVIIKIKPP